MTDADTLLLRRLLDLARQADTREMYTFSNFLSLPEQSLFASASRDYAFIPHHTYGGVPGAERVIAVFGSEERFGYPPDYPVRILEVLPESERFAEMLTHRDYLGAVLSLGIDRSLVGDIVIRGTRAWICVLDTAAEFLAENLTSVRHTAVRASVAAGDVPAAAPVFEDLRLNVPSERLDAIVAAFTNISRSRADALFAAERVFVNGRVTESGSKPLKPGDILTVRGFGKAVYEGVDGTSRKGRLYVLLRKYS